jgi:predicted nuclease of predicted toxin-antitoxin system
LPILLVDESVTRTVREWLRKQGFDMVNVCDIGLKGARDQEIANYAEKNLMTILTLDTDFAQIYHNSPKGTLGVIVIRANPSTPAVILEILNKAHEKINLKKIDNKLLIITKRKIRIIS